MGDLIPRGEGDDVIVQVRMRRKNYEALRHGEVPIDHASRLSLVDDAPEDARWGPSPLVDGVVTLVVHTRDYPIWPEPVPANEQSMQEVKRRGGV